MLFGWQGWTATVVHTYFRTSMRSCTMLAYISIWFSSGGNILKHCLPGEVTKSQSFLWFVTCCRLRIRSCLSLYTAKCAPALAPRGIYGIYLVQRQSVLSQKPDIFSRTFSRCSNFPLAMLSYPLPITEVSKCNSWSRSFWL